MTAPLERDEAGPGSPESPESLEGEAARRPRLRLAVMVPVVGTLAIVTLLFVPAGRRLLYRTIYAVGPVKTRLRVMEAVTAELREEATAQGGMVAPERLSLLALAMQRDPSALVRASAAQKLSGLGLESARPSLTRGLANAESRVRAHAAHGLGALEPRAATVAVLVELVLEDPVVNVRTAGLSALLSLQQQQPLEASTLAALRPLAGDSQSTVARLAQELLARASSSHSTSRAKDDGS